MPPIISAKVNSCRNSAQAKTLTVTPVADDQSSNSLGLAGDAQPCHIVDEHRPCIAAACLKATGTLVCFLWNRYIRSTTFVEMSSLYLWII